MIKRLCKRTLSVLLILCTVLSILPASSFAALRTNKAGTTRAATELASAIAGLAAPIARTNTFVNNITVSNTGLLAGTFFIVNKDSSGQYRVIDASKTSTNGTLAATNVTVSNNSVVGADPSLAIDLVHNSSNTYVPRTSKPLNYVSAANNYFQMRFRIDDAIASDLRVKGAGRIVLFYSADPASSNEANFVYYDFKAANEIVDKGWITLTFKTSDMTYNKDGMKYADMNTINAFTP